MDIYTRTGDKGKTSLFDNSRVDKDSIRVESYGTIDELNSSLGFARSFIEDEKIIEIIKKIQRELFNVAGELATGNGEEFPERVEKEQIENLEATIDDCFDAMNEKEKSQFIVPGSSKGSAALHVSRTICRRAERRITTLSRDEDISPLLQKYVNRLSDAIYSLARYSEVKLDYVDFKKQQ